MHDSNGTELRAGDRVIVEFEVEQIGPADDQYCNLTAKSVPSGRAVELPEHMRTSTITTNARNVTLLRRAAAVATMLLAAVFIAGCQGTVTGGTGSVGLTLDPVTQRVIGLDIRSNRDTVIERLEVDVATGKLVVVGYSGNGSTIGGQQERLGTVQSNNATLIGTRIVDQAGNVIGVLLPGGGAQQLVTLPQAAPVAPSGPGTATPTDTTAGSLSAIKQYALERIAACQFMDAARKASLTALVQSPLTPDSLVGGVIDMLPTAPAATQQQ